MDAPESSLVVPFAVIEREGAPAEEFPFGMTLATVLADVEMRRAKAGVLRKREEGLEFASILYWPIAIVPWTADRHLVFDGMGVWSYVFSRGMLPDTKAFAAALDAATESPTLLRALQDRAALFDAFPDAERVPVMGLFIHEELMKDILAHIALAKPRQLKGSPLLTPRLSPEHAMQAVKRMHALIDEMRLDRVQLDGASQALERAGSKGRATLAGLREKTLRDFEWRIEEIRPDVASRVSTLEKEREDRWSAMQARLVDLQGRVQAAQAEVSQWENQASSPDPSLSSTGRARVGEARQRLDREWGDLRRYQEDIAHTRANYDRQIQAQWDRIRELERQRDAEVARLNQEEQTLAGLAAHLSQGIAGLSQRTDEGVRFLESQGVPAAVPGRTTVRLPIFVVSLVSDRGRRLVVYPPMVAKVGKGVMDSLKSTFGGIVLPLEPKTQHFEEVFRRGIEQAVAEDASLSTYLVSVGNANNLLHLANLRDLLTRGLADLRAQGWIKDRHERELIVSLERHIAAAAHTAPRGGPPG